LQGLQYVVLFILAVVFGRRFRALYEPMTASMVVRKIFALVLISCGLVLIV